MSKVGYARVSRKDQNLGMQISELKRYGCEIIFQEKMSGASQRNRIEFKKMTNYLREGDTLVCWKMDRIGRSAKEICFLLEELDLRGINIVSLTEGIDTKTPLGRAFAFIASIFAEIERSNMQERTIEALKDAVARGVILGRPRGLSKKSLENKKKSCSLLSKGYTVSQIAEILKISRPTVYRYISNDVNNV